MMYVGTISCLPAYLTNTIKNEANVNQWNLKYQKNWEFSDRAYLSIVKLLKIQTFKGRQELER